MGIIDFFRDSPVLATILTLAYIIICGVFIYMFVRMYQKK